MNERLASEKISRLLFKLSLPCIFAQIITLLYSLVDRVYIGAMDNGVQAMAAIGLCTPVISLILAVSALFGRGGAPLSSIAMGEGNHKEAEKIFNTSLQYLILSSILFMAVIYVFQNPLLSALGAVDEQSRSLTRTYLLIYTAGTLFSVLSTGLNYFINTQGYTGFGMFSQVSGAVLNLILDPIFIFALHMSIAGAALATILSQLASFILSFSFFFTQKNKLKIHISQFGLNAKESKKIMVLGSSPCFMSASEGVLMLCFNQQLLLYGGVEALSAMTILSSMFQLLLHPMEGVAQGAQPILSFNYGAQNYDRVEKTIKTAIRANLIVSLAGTALIELFPSFFIGWFMHDEELIAFTVPMLRIYLFGCCIMGANSTYQQTYNSLGHGGYSFFFAFLRKIILLIPLLYILPALHLFPASPWLAVVLAEPISDLTTTLSNTAVFFRFVKKTLHPVQQTKPVPAAAKNLQRA